MPIVGINKKEHLQENLGASKIEFSPKELGEINKHLDSIKITGDRLCEAFNKDIAAQNQ